MEPVVTHKPTPPPKGLLAIRPGTTGARLTSLGLAGQELLRGDGHVAGLAADREAQRWASITVAFSWGTPLAWIPS